jgi:hypothetical protein
LCPSLSRQGCCERGLAWYQRRPRSALTDKAPSNPDLDAEQPVSRPAVFPCCRADTAGSMLLVVSRSSRTRNYLLQHARRAATAYLVVSANRIACFSLLVSVLACAAEVRVFFLSEGRLGCEADSPGGKHMPSRVWAGSCQQHWLHFGVHEVADTGHLPADHNLRERLSVVCLAPSTKRDAQISECQCVPRLLLPEDSGLSRVGYDHVLRLYTCIAAVAPQRRCASVNLDCSIFTWLTAPGPPPSSPVTCWSAKPSGTMDHARGLRASTQPM